jgi:hypothetical protein
MVLGSFTLSIQALILYLIREDILNDPSSKALMTISYFIAGIGSVWCEEGLYLYLNIDLKWLFFRNAD